LSETLKLRLTPNTCVIGKPFAWLGHLAQGLLSETLKLRLAPNTRLIGKSFAWLGHLAQGLLSETLKLRRNTGTEGGTLDRALWAYSKENQGKR
jgi:hypothetical protein